MELDKVDRRWNDPHAQLYNSININFFKFSLDFEIWI
jgi:hypothetical protein